MTVNEAIIELRAEMEQFAQAIAERLMPPIITLAETLHVLWFEEQPWWRRWWHTMFGHR